MSSLLHTTITHPFPPTRTSIQIGGREGESTILPLPLLLPAFKRPRLSRLFELKFFWPPPSLPFLILPSFNVDTRTHAVNSIRSGAFTYIHTFLYLIFFDFFCFSFLSFKLGYHNSFRHSQVSLFFSVSTVLFTCLANSWGCLWNRSHSRQVSPPFLRHPLSI